MGTYLACFGIRARRYLINTVRSPLVRRGSSMQPPEVHLSSCVAGKAQKLSKEISTQTSFQDPDKGSNALKVVSNYESGKNQARQHDEKQIDCSIFNSNNCPRLYQPVCGSDGKTYDNLCVFCNTILRSNGSLVLRYLGECY
ncbi:serine protease inhibitor Kazal-type 7-like isoform X3 [Hemicordylus capensis]|uniref:serine protease inhibitor Kazal-type 7-like isoform X3 n=1 Tax=Hemicordylus capensis TaxID=884348 RepID=UPI0023037CD3|nr:serine protease inhibitor Kazal-type 7-like isoform X3 [Hemicordylus capensis]